MMYHLKPVIIGVIVFISLIHVHTCTSAPSVSFQATDIDTNGIVYQRQKAALLNSPCDVSATLRMKRLGDSGTSLSIASVLPFTSSSEGPCEELNSVSTFVVCTPRVNFLENSVQLKVDGVTVDRKLYTFEKPKLQTIVVTMNTASARIHDNSLIELKYKIITLNDVREIGEVYNFTFSAVVKDDSASVSETDSVLLKIIGPRISVRADPPNIILDANGSANVKIVIENSPLSTNNLSNIKILGRQSLSEALTVSRKTKDGGIQPYPMNLTHPKELAVGDTIEIDTHLQLGAEPHIGHSLDVPFLISYTQTGTTSPVYTLEQCVRVATVRDISDITSSMGIPEELTPGALIPVLITFQVPKGVLPSLSVVLEGQSSAASPAKAVILRSNIELSSGLWTANHKLLRYSFDQSGHGPIGRLRKKRHAILQQQTSRIHGVTIKHSVNEPNRFAEIVLNSDVRVSPAYFSSLPEAMMMKIGLSYGKIHRVVRSAPVSLVYPNLISFVKSYTLLYNHDGYPEFKVTVLVHHNETTANTKVEDDITGLAVSDIKTNCTVDTHSVTGSKIVYAPNASVCIQYELTYTAKITRRSADRFGRSVNMRYATLVYTLSSDPNTTTVTAYGCINRANRIKETYFPLYGLIVLLIFVGLLIGFLLLFIVGIIYIKVVNRDVNPFDYDNVGEMEDKAAMLESENQLLMDGGSGKGDFSTITGLSTIKYVDSIIMILTNGNRNQIYRELDSWDVLASILVDQGLEVKYQAISTEALIILVQNLVKHGTLKQDVVNKATQTYKKSLETLEKEVSAAHKKESQKAMKAISKKNKREMQELLSKQRTAKDALEEDLRGEDKEARKDILELQKKEHKAERDNLVYKLKLQQDEESERLRKKYALQKRSMARELGRNLLEEIRSRNPASPELMEWILKEHQRVQGHLDQRYDAEVARQRMLLEEKLERRRALARQKELEEENQTDRLNTLASQQVNTVRRMRREEEISPEKAEDYLARITTDMLAAKEALDREKAMQEKVLRERLNQRKKAEFEVKATNHKLETSDLEKRLKESGTQDMLDPVAFVDAVFDLEVKQRNDIDRMENGFDVDDTNELIERYQVAVGEAEGNIRLMKDQLMQQLKEDGVPESELSRLTELHNKELLQLEAAHQEERDIQDQNFKAKLKARQKEMEANLSMEQEEQEGLRQHENKMVQALLMNQVSISDEERNRILMEHERNMVQVENSLTLSKLRQKRMLEEALAERKAKQMQRLQKKQEAETKTKLQKGGDSDDEDGDNRDVLDMMKRHEEQKLDLLHGDSADIEDEMENVRTKLMEERANALKEQEERIAGMLSNLQIEKAKELAKIEEQQKAINNLKMNLMEDLNERGVLSDDRCQQIITRHQEEQAELVERLDNQRNKQEKLLRDRLNERMRQREQQMSSSQRQKIEEQVSQLPPKMKAQAQIRKAMLLHKQMLEMEQFRNRMTKECNQALEEAKRQFDVKKEQYLQEQELNFIAGLVRLGKFNKTELLAVLKILFPLKSSEELEEILKKIHSGKDDPAPKGGSQSPAKTDQDILSESTLVGRTEVLFRGMGAVARFKEGLKERRRSKRGNLMNIPLGGDKKGLTPIDRPDPLGRDSPPTVPDTPHGRGGDLPPLEPRRSKKKKKKRKQRLIEEEDEEDDDVIKVRS